ncbi:unnamed protein product [Mytilus coruscus]|uniref:Uncharacterized protein n=1 Tax=Mytilus coruscus TaxID=42192 RepID=A0A6J8CW32_MYTCO|nr:unnamed protein product [Mytilus coruscus]
MEGYALTLSRGEEQAYNMIKTEHDDPVYDLINTNHDKTDKRVNISWRQWLVFVLLTIIISLVTSGLAVAVTYLSVWAELEVRIDKNYALLMTKQNISATDIPALVNETRAIPVILSTHYQSIYTINKIVNLTCDCRQERTCDCHRERTCDCHQGKDLRLSPGKGPVTVARKGFVTVTRERTCDCHRERTCDCHRERTCGCHQGKDM